MNDFGSGPGMIPHTGSLNQTGGPGCLCRTCSLEKQISFLKARHDALRASHTALLKALKAIVGQPGRSKGHIAWCVSHEQPPKLCNCGFEAGRAAIAAAEEIAKHV